MLCYGERSSSCWFCLPFKDWKYTFNWPKLGENEAYNLRNVLSLSAGGLDTLSENNLTGFILRIRYLYTYPSSSLAKNWYWKIELFSTFLNEANSAVSMSSSIRKENLPFVKDGRARTEFYTSNLLNFPPGEWLNVAQHLILAFIVREHSLIVAEKIISHSFPPC